MSESFDAAVVGSGPNGLAAAIRLAQAGRSVVLYEGAERIGGGLRSEALIEPDTVHDLCSAVHPFGAASPFFSQLPLGEHGLTWLHPEVLAAHPVQGQPTPVLLRDVDDTCAALGADGEAWRRLIGWPASHSDALLREIFQPVNHVPRSPVVLVRFGVGALVPATLLADQLFDTPGAKALFAGMAAHTIAPLSFPLSSAVAIMLSAAGHAAGWPIAQGGSQAIADSLASYFRSLGGVVRTDTKVSSLSQLQTDGPVLFDTGPAALANIAGDALPSRFARRLRKMKHGPGVFKIDYLLSEPVPWADPEIAKAGTVHVGGTLEEVAASERAAWDGKVSERPFVLVSQPTQIDPSRSSAGRHVLWAYCHAPHGSTVDMTGQLENQIERYAPGFREVVVARHTTDAADFEARNPNLVGGDIAGGASRPVSLLARPMASLKPYSTPNDRIFLCSASTPPGAGVHGMCGYWAAEAALKS